MSPCQGITSNGIVIEDAKCGVTLTPRGKTQIVKSKCPEFTILTYATAIEGSLTTPCTNVPVVCKICYPKDTPKETPAVWRYNLEEHIRLRHAGHTLPSHFDFNTSFYRLCNIPAAEQVAMGIPQEQVPPPLFSTPHSPSNSDTLTVPYTPSKRPSTATPLSPLRPSKSTRLNAL